MIGVRNLAKMLKENEHPNWEETHDDLDEVRQNKLKFFKPQFLVASDWHPDHTPYNVANHCAEETCKPNLSMSAPETNFLFSNIRKKHHSRALMELEARQVQFD